MLKFQYEHISREHLSYLQGFAPYLISPLEGISNLGVTTTYSLGCKVACNNTEGFPNAVKLVQDSKVDAVIAVIGLNYTQEG